MGISLNAAGGAIAVSVTARIRCRSRHPYASFTVVDRIISRTDFRFAEFDNSGQKPTGQTANFYLRILAFTGFDIDFFTSVC